MAHVREEVAEETIVKDNAPTEDVGVPTVQIPETIKEKCCSQNAKLFVLTLALFLALIAYTFIGAAIFMAFENTSKTKSARKNITINLREEFLTQIWNSSRSSEPDAFETWLSESTEKLQELRKRLDASGTTDEDENVLSTPSKWNFWSSVFFCGTVYTTIGYGNIAPETSGGKVAAMLYATIGIPLCLMVLAKLGQVLDVLLRPVYRVNKSAILGVFQYSTNKWKQRKQRNSQNLSTTACIESQNADLTTPTETSKGTKEQSSSEPLPLWFAIALNVCYIFFGAAVYRLWETQWSYLDSFYFVFVSLSTIGFGDILPEHPRYFLLSSLYILMGLALVSLCLNVMLEAYTKAAEEARLRAEEAAVRIIDEIEGSSDDDTSSNTRTTLAVLAKSSLVHHSQHDYLEKRNTDRETDEDTGVAGNDQLSEKSNRRRKRKKRKKDRNGAHPQPKELTNIGSAPAEAEHGDLSRNNRKISPEPT